MEGPLKKALDYEILPGIRWWEAIFGIAAAYAIVYS